jgi:hypothetical protein
MARLTYRARKALPKRDFAVPPDGYPIEDKAHARDAISRASANASPHERAMVVAAVRHKYPSIKISK